MPHVGQRMAVAAAVAGVRVSASSSSRSGRSRIASVNGNSSTISPSSSVTSMTALSSAPSAPSVLSSSRIIARAISQARSGIAQDFAVGIGDQLVADTGVEEIARHRLKLGSVESLPLTEARLVIRTFGGPAAPLSYSKITIHRGANNSEKGLMPRGFDGNCAHKFVSGPNLPCAVQHAQMQGSRQKI